MNRRQRREMERKYGISQHHKSLSLNAKMELVRNNIIESKKNREESSRQDKSKEQDLISERASSQIYDLALKISMEEKVPFMDAIDLAKTRLKETK